MVLTRALVAMLLVAGCSESLFDAHGGRRGDGGPGGDDGGVDADIPVPTTCPDPCIADAAADYNGVQGGKNGVWHYFDDHRNRAWMRMTETAGEMTGLENDRIASCTDHPTTTACQGLPGAILVSSGGVAASDPAIEYQSPAAQVIQLSFHAYVPSDGQVQKVRLYRNSREDVLFTRTAMPGSTVSHTMFVDALADDRFLIALEPMQTAVGQVALHFFVNGPIAAFPSACKLALAFESASGDKVNNLCSDSIMSPTLSFLRYNNGAPLSAPVSLNVTGPFSELGQAADIALDRYFQASDLNPRPGAVTVQLWVRHDALGAAKAYVFSNLDKDVGGGLAVALFDMSGPKIEVTSARKVGQADVSNLAAYPFPLGGWHFIRVVGSNDKVTVCLDGGRATDFDYPTADLVSTFPVHLGKNVTWEPAGAFFKGGIDDVRVLSTALPCE
ncbi:MAG TPA: LamG-like jellyroll fold domain-containing protein [Kofleriaceae bacterium]|nr:LamG-like jellyroll fold domain-containing protein [Kofleriaceae bacterium]